MTGAVSHVCGGKGVSLRLPAVRVRLLALEGATLLARVAVLVAIFVHSVIRFPVAEYSPLLEMALTRHWRLARERGPQMVAPLMGRMRSYASTHPLMKRSVIGFIGLASFPTEQAGSRRHRLKRYAAVSEEVRSVPATWRRSDRFVPAILAKRT